MCQPISLRPMNEQQIDATDVPALGGDAERCLHPGLRQIHRHIHLGSAGKQDLNHTRVTFFARDVKWRRAVISGEVDIRSTSFCREEELDTAGVSFPGCIPKCGCATCIPVFVWMVSRHQTEHGDEL